MHTASVPVWLIAIAAAAAAPFCVRFYAGKLERRLRRRTERALGGGERSEEQRKPTEG